MTNKKSTKRALLVSAMAMVICFTMLLGTTFAWFTDSASSNGNIIKAGTLDVEMKWAEANVALADAVWVEETGTDDELAPMFTYTKWEPGYVEAKYIEISNPGTLAFNYKLRIVPVSATVTTLATTIDVYYYATAQEVYRSDLDPEDPADTVKYLGTLNNVLNGDFAVEELEAGQSEAITLVFKMNENAGNDFQNMDLGTQFSVQVLATQKASESDSIGTDYDANAPEL